MMFMGKRACIQGWSLESIFGSQMISERNWKGLKPNRYMTSFFQVTYAKILLRRIRRMLAHMSRAPKSDIQTLKMYHNRQLSYWLFVCTARLRVISVYPQLTGGWWCRRTRGGKQVWLTGGTTFSRWMHVTQWILMTQTWITCLNSSVWPPLIACNCPSQTIWQLAWDVSLFKIKNTNRSLGFVHAKEMITWYKAPKTPGFWASWSHDSSSLWASFYSAVKICLQRLRCIKASQNP